MQCSPTSTAILVKSIKGNVTLVTLGSDHSVLAHAAACLQVTLKRRRSIHVTVTWLAAFAGGEVEGVGHAAVTSQACDAGVAGALTQGTTLQVYRSYFIAFTVCEREDEEDVPYYERKRYCMVVLLHVCILVCMYKLMCRSNYVQTDAQIQRAGTI